MKTQLITLSNFESRLDDMILSKGHDYIENVDDLQCTSNSEYNEWRAEVEGTETYLVVIRADIKTDVIRFSSCSCPFDASFCKHRVAVLYAIQMSGRRKPKKSSDKVGDILSKLTFDELKQYVKARMESDKELKKHFLSAFAVKTLRTVEEFKQVIELALRPLKRNHGFVHHRVYIDAVKPIETLVASANRCLEAGDYQTAINIYLATLEKLVPAFQDVDDSGGMLSAIVDDVFLSLNLIKEDEPPRSVLSDLVGYAIKKATSAGMRGSDHSWEFAGLAAGLADSQDEQAIKDMVVALKKEGKGNEFVEGYSAERAANVLLHYFFNNKTESEVDDFIGQNLKFTSVRNLAIERAMRAKEYDKILKLCKDGIEEAERAKHPGIVSQLRNQMLSIYLIQNDKANIVKTAELVFNELRGDLESYRVLKEHMDREQWVVKSVQYKQKLEKSYNYADLAEILKEENNQEELLRILTLSRSFELLDEYESAISDTFKSDVQDIYFSLITESLESRADRNNYRYNAQLLKRMLGKYNDARTIAFANSLREQYRQRKALLEEFRIVPVSSNR